LHNARDFFLPLAKAHPIFFLPLAKAHPNFFLPLAPLGERGPGGEGVGGSTSSNVQLTLARIPRANSAIKQRTSRSYS
jgi:hypothetical protein